MKDEIVGFRLLRFVSVAAVVGIHSFHTNHLLGHVANRYFGFAVPCFFMMSFFLTTKKFSEQNFSAAAKWFYWGGRLKRLFPGFACWTVIYLSARVFKGTHISLAPQALADYFFLGGAALQLYYIPLLFYYTGISLLLLSLRRRCQQIVSSLVLLIIGVFMFLYVHDLFHGKVSNGKIFIDYAIGDFPYVSLGLLLYYLTKKFTTWEEILKMKKIFLFPSFLMLAVILFILPDSGTFWPYVHNMLGAVAVFLSFFYWPFGDAGWIRWMSKMSFGIYLSHHLFIEAAQLLESRSGINSSLAIVTFFNFLFGFFMAALLCALLDRNKFTRFIAGIQQS